LARVLAGTGGTQHPAGNLGAGVRHVRAALAVRHRLHLDRGQEAS